MPSLTRLQQKVTREIVAIARRENWPAGHRLAKIPLAAELNTSHNPVEAALAHLAEIGVARHEPDRGYFLAHDANELGVLADKLVAAEDPLYLKIADARLAHRLPDTVTETELARLFKTTTAAIRRTLLRVQQEGWVERRTGQGWSFLPLIDSQEAYEESYEMRRALEPAAIVSPKFQPDRAELTALQRQQAFIAESGYATMTPIELWDLNARFHESIARWSGNRFIHQTVRRLNQLRRLVEYKQASAGPREPRQDQARQHLEILRLIELGDYVGAAALVRDHLQGARDTKVRPSVFG
ncbi:MAG TPA: GntR family transcriptional regulator [Burkholderiales bacterium]|nr:GntR family transcriptional regulator [Burkholderiales bacterium]